MLVILCQEADQYFDGSNMAREMVAVVENREKLYLNESKQTGISAGIAKTIKRPFNIFR